ncbi:MAG: hypothetical protein J0G95_10925 [Rhizobiales bacterium]|nr:hypothetical protein [Hyphomicrobiales bacterium]
MTPSQLAFHEAHKARMARFAAAADRNSPPVPLSRPIASAVAVLPVSNDAMKEAHRAFTLDGFGYVPPVQAIQRAVAAYYGHSLLDLMSQRRTQKLALHRQVAMYLAKSMTEKSFPEIGRCFKRDHTTVLYAVNRIDDMLKARPDLVNDMKSIRALLEDCDATATEDSHNAESSVSHEAAIAPPCRTATRSDLAHGQAASPREPGGSA